jgi:hypothetical protein
MLSDLRWLGICEVEVSNIVGCKSDIVSDDSLECSWCWIWEGIKGYTSDTARFWFSRNLDLFSNRILDSITKHMVIKHSNLNICSKWQCKFVTLATGHTLSFFVDLFVNLRDESLPSIVVDLRPSIRFEIVSLWDDRKRKRGWLIKSAVTTDIPWRILTTFPDYDEQSVCTRSYLRSPFP